MKNVCDFKDSEKLKQEGFVQPKFKVGQFWWNPREPFLMFIIEVDDENVHYVVVGNRSRAGSFPINYSKSKFYIYAPTEADICEDESILSDQFDHMTVKKSYDGTYRAGCIRSFGMDSEVMDYNSRTECAAACWLLRKTYTHG